jgi:hypothetical protein
VATENIASVIPGRVCEPYCHSLCMILKSVTSTQQLSDTSSTTDDLSDYVILESLHLPAKIYEGKLY